MLLKVVECLASGYERVKREDGSLPVLRILPGNFVWIACLPIVLRILEISSVSRFYFEFMRIFFSYVFYSYEFNVLVSAVLVEGSYCN